MQNEIRFAQYVDNYKETLNELDLDMFLKLFVDSRPVYGIRLIISAMRCRCWKTREMTGEDIVKILTTEG